MTQTPKAYSHINLTYLTEIADGDEQFIEETIRTYLQTIPSELNQLSSSIRNENWEQTAFHAHTLKGAFNFVGATSLAALCGHIEEVCNSQTVDIQLQQILTEVVSESIGVSDDLKAALLTMHNSIVV